MYFSSGAPVHMQLLSTGKDELHRSVSSKCPQLEADNGLGSALVPFRRRRHQSRDNFHSLQRGMEQGHSLLDLEHQGIFGE